MKRVILIAVALLALLAIAAAFDAFDERLDPEVEAILADDHAPVPDERNLALAVLALAESGLVPDSVDDACVFPATGASDCLGTVAGDPDAARAALAGNDELLARYRGLYAYDRFLNPQPEHFDSEILPWRQVTRAQRLQLTRVAVRAVEDGDIDGAAVELAHDIAHWRAVMGQPALWLIDKMVALALVQNGVSLAGELLARDDLGDPGRAGLLAALHPLTEAERDLTPTLRNEFRILAQLPEMRGTGAKGFIMRFMYQPKATINRSHEFFAAFDTTAPAGCHDREAQDVGIPPHRRALHRVVNVVGENMLRIALPDYGRYIGRICEFDQRLAALHSS